MQLSGAAVLLLCTALVWGEQQYEDDVGKLRLTVAYCPTEFSSAGAIVEVDPHSGDFTIIGKFKWPSEIIGCDALDDPTVTLDPSTGMLYMYFIDEEMVAVVDVVHATLVHHFEPSDIFFTGFENMQWDSVHQVLKGVSATVTQSGFCSDGCFQYGNLTLSRKYRAGQLIPFKAMMDDSHYYDPVSNKFWIQGSYDLRPVEQRCYPQDDTALCLLQLDGDTGALESAVFTNWTIYKYSQPKANYTMLAWMEGFDQLCKHPYNDFLFAEVNLKTATAVPVACIPTDVTVQMDEWISSFSFDGSLFATGSGDAETGEGQLLVFNTNSNPAKVVLNTDLSGLKKALNTADGLFFVWSVDFVHA